ESSPPPARVREAGGKRPGGPVRQSHCPARQCDRGAEPALVSGQFWAGAYRCAASNPPSGNEGSRNNTAPETDSSAKAGCEGHGDIGPKAVEGAMRDINDSANAEDEGESGRDKKQTGRRGQAIDSLKREAFHCHARKLARNLS